MSWGAAVASGKPVVLRGTAKLLLAWSVPPLLPSFFFLLNTSQSSHYSGPVMEVGCF